MKLNIFATHRFGQRMFLGAGALFSILLLALAIQRSAGRSHVFSSSLVVNEQQTASDIQPTGEANTKFHLQDFHRVEVKNGSPIWEVSARDAKYHALEQLAFVNEATVLIYKNHKPQIRFRSDEGKLFLKGESLERAELQGNIEVEMEDDLRFKADEAAYDRGTGEISSQGKVVIFGPGYQVIGVGMRMSLDGQTVDLLRQVESQFEQTAKVPTESIVN